MICFGKIALSSLMLVSCLSAPTVCTKHYRDNAAMPCAVNTVDVPYLSRRHSGYYSLATHYPDFTYSSALGSCANTAGGNLLGYYDRFDENLIPDHVSGTPYGISYVYYIQDKGVEAVIDILTSYMKTTSDGTTEADFKSGMQKYCKEKKKTIVFTSCMESGKLSFTSCMDYIQNNQPIVLFVKGYNVADIYFDENEDSISYYTSSANHVMVAFGYDSYIYTTTNGTLTFNFLKVASGKMERSTGLFNIDYNTIIDDALSVNIY